MFNNKIDYIISELIRKTLRTNEKDITKLDNDNYYYFTSNFDPKFENFNIYSFSPTMYTLLLAPFLITLVFILPSKLKKFKAFANLFPASIYIYFSS